MAGAVGDPRRAGAVHSKTALPPSIAFRDFVEELELLVRSRYGLIVIDTWEIDRADRALRHVASQLSLTFHAWARSKGIRRRPEAGARLIDDTGAAERCAPARRA